MESMFVGIYCVILYFLFSFLMYFSLKHQIIKESFSIYFFFFWFGFIKHILGYFLGLHTLYCNMDSNTTQKATMNYLFIGSIFEGFLFTSIVYFISIFSLTSSIFNENNWYKIKTYITIFGLGVSLHLVFELFGIHMWFKQNICVPLT